MGHYASSSGSYVSNQLYRIGKCLLKFKKYNSLSVSSTNKKNAYRDDVDKRFLYSTISVRFKTNQYQTVYAFSQRSGLVYPSRLLNRGDWVGIRGGNGRVCPS